MNYEGLKKEFRGMKMSRKLRQRAVSIFGEDKKFPKISCGGFAIVDLEEIKQQILKKTTVSGELFIIGRADDADFDLTTVLNPGVADNSVSRYHCYVERQKTPSGEQFVLYDCSSTWTATVD